MDRSNGEARAKRKASPVAPLQRPAKQLRPELATLINGDDTPQASPPPPPPGAGRAAGGGSTGSLVDGVGGSPVPDGGGGGLLLADDDEPGRLLPPAAATADSAEWQATIERVVRNVVSIHFCQTCSFDTDAACSSEATGFVVDAERGYILTNRHVVCAGPFWGYCIFDNHEECEVRPVYRDPIHDFGFLRFDPKKIKYMPLEALELRPDLAKVGAEIRVVGNDAGEKLSILSGVISRLDRNAPEYGEGYSDFNTNYIQAAAAASGGSSGSPVVNVDGYAVALQAGGRADGAATDYFLPLDRPLRALECIRSGTPVTRGTIQTQWVIKPFDECRRLGLTQYFEELIRKSFPKETGMLVAEIVLPEGPADSLLQEGDILIMVNGQLLTQFVRLDDILDSCVGRKITVVVQRGDVDVEVELSVGDLHAITPDRFVTVAGSSFHNLSYQQARLYAIPVRGVYVCEAAGSFRFENSESGWLIESIDQKRTPDLDAFVAVMAGIRDRARVVVTYKHLRDLHTVNTSIFCIDRHWTAKMRMAVRNDATGLWDFRDLSDPLPAAPPVPRAAEFPQMESNDWPAASEVIKSFVRVSCTMPVKLDGFPRARKIGFGLVVDAAKGLVVVSRAVVPYDLCDLSITVADSVIVDANVVFLHPLANYAIIQYDPALVLAPVQSARLSDKTMKQGASTIFLGFNQNLRAVLAKTTVTDITTVAIPSNATAPRYRALNLDAITVDTGLSGQCGNGVLLAEDGTVEALWMAYLGERSAHSNKDVEYHLGLASPSFRSVVDAVRRGDVPDLRILSIETNTVQMSQVRIMGVSEEWIARVVAANPARHQLFMVRKVDCAAPIEVTAAPSPQGASDSPDTADPATAAAATTAAPSASVLVPNGTAAAPAAPTLLEGDIILTLNEQLITRVSELDVMYDAPSLRARIVRAGQEMTLDVPTVPTHRLQTARALLFCGAVLHAPHHAVRQQISRLHSGVYVSARARGSPAYMYGLAPTNFITAVDGDPTPDLDAFAARVARIPDNAYFRLRVVTFDNVPWVATMKKNEHYFPTLEYVRDPQTGRWTKRAVGRAEDVGDARAGGAGSAGTGLEGAASEVEAGDTEAGADII